MNLLNSSLRNCRGATFACFLTSSKIAQSSRGISNVKTSEAVCFVSSWWSIHGVSRVTGGTEFGKATTLLLVGGSITTLHETVFKVLGVE